LIFLLVAAAPAGGQPVDGPVKALKVTVLSTMLARTSSIKEMSAYGTGH
jgi:hypothetical protein